MMNYNNVFEGLEKKGVVITEEQKAKIRSKIENVINYEPRVGVFGKTGAGKSSLCNALFGQDVCEISDVEACTRSEKEIMLNISSGKGIKIIDVPGVGENSDRDIEYGQLYAKLLPELDVVLWVLKADDRAYASDENFYKNLVKPHLDQGKPFFFVLNQVDKVEPFREWDEDKHEPGPKQFMNIDRKVQYVANCFDVPSSKVIPVSAVEQYNMVKLVDEIVYALPKEKKITVFKNINEDFRSEATGETVRRSFLEVVQDVVLDVLDRGVEKFCNFIDTVEDVVVGVIDTISSFMPWNW